MSDEIKKHAEVNGEVMWEVYDPWEAKVLAYFFYEHHAKMFRKAYDKQRNRAEG